MYRRDFRWRLKKYLYSLGPAYNEFSYEDSFSTNKLYYAKGISVHDINDKKFGHGQYPLEQRVCYASFYSLSVGPSLIKNPFIPHEALVLNIRNRMWCCRLK